MLSAGVRGASFSQLFSRFGELAIGEQRRHVYSIFGGPMGNRHRDPKWKKHRDNKVIRVKLPDFEKLRRRAAGVYDREEVGTSLSFDSLI